MNLTRKILTALTLPLAAFAFGQSVGYAPASIEIKAGVIVMPAQQFRGVSANPAPHIWGNLDRDQATKPAKWTFVNPVSQNVLTSGTRARWSILDGGLLPGVNTRLTKRNAPYWEVPIDELADGSLSQYNILSLSINQGLSLNAEERDKLRRYVDQGGVLWVDLINDSPDAAISLDVFNPPPLPFGRVTLNGTLDANLFHQILSYPNAFTLNDLALTDYPLATQGNLVTTPLGNNTFTAAVEPFAKWIVTDSNAWQPVAGIATDRNTISVGKIGQGFIVLTSRGITGNLNRGALAGSSNANQINRGFAALGTPNDANFAAAARFAMNVVSLGGVSTSKDAGPHHTSSNSVDLTAPLLRRFTDTPGNGFEVGQQPALYKGRVIVSDGDSLLVYDSRPDRDIDGDGFPDDGILDPMGNQGDLIWKASPGAGTLSAPTVVENAGTTIVGQQAGVSPTDQVWVQAANGDVYVYDLDAVGGNVNNLQYLLRIPAPANFAPMAKGPFAPVVHESLVFITDESSGAVGNVGRVWAIDLKSGIPAETTAKWAIQQSTRFGEPSGPATVGYIPIQDGSGGLDRVLYVPSLRSSGATQRPAGLTSIWLGARAESPVRRDYNAGVLTVTTRASYNGLPILFQHPSSATLPDLKSLGIKVTLIKANGDPVPGNEMATIFGAATISEPARGVLQFSNLSPLGYDLDGKQTPGTGDDVGWRLDYTVDWGQAGSGNFGPSNENYVRGNLELPDESSNPEREIIGSIALGPNGNIYVVTSKVSGTDSGGTYFNFKENRGPGNFTLVSKFDLYDRLTFGVNNNAGAADQIGVPPVLTDQDNLVQILNFLKSDIVQWKFTSGPALRNGSVFVMASGVKTGLGVPVGVLMSFKAEVATPTFEIEGTDSNFTIVQADPTLSTNKTNPEQYSSLQPGQFTLEPIPGTTRSKIVVNNLMNVSRGRIRDAINSSLPLMIRRAGQTDTVIEPEAIVDSGRIIAGRASGRWNPLQWYLCFNGFRPGAGPIVAGQTLYQGGSSVLPSLINGNGLAFNGLIFAMDADISGNDEFLVANTDRPWTLQYNTFLSATNTFNDIRPATAVKWPQFKGIQHMDDLRIRILQATISEDNVRNMAAGDESLAVTGPASLYGFSRSDFIVVDAGRVSKFDPSGNPIFVTDQTQQSGSAGPTVPQATARQLSEPNRAYPTTDNGYWIVDTGNNRVVRTDGTGREKRSIDGFKIDPQFKPDGINDEGSAAGMTAAETLKLRRPKDIYTFETTVDLSKGAKNPFSNPRPLERWVHTLIADSGNSRIVELIDRYEVNPITGRTIGVVQYQDPPASGNLVQGLGVLFWHSPEELTGKGYSYNSIARTVQLVGGQRHNVVAFGFGNVEPGTASLGLDPTNQNVDSASGYGGVVLYDGPNSTVIREFQKPAINANTFIGENPPGSGVFNYNLPVNNQPARMQKLIGIRSVSTRYVTGNAGLQLSVMITDSTGIYELVQDLAQGGIWVARWMLPLEAYSGMRHPRGGAPFNLAGLGNNPQGFRPMYASRLDSGEVLVVNGYIGNRIDGTQFDGEVILIDGDFAGAGTQAEDPGYDRTRPNLGFNRLSVKFELPPIQGTRGIISPVFAQRQ